MLTCSVSLTAEQDVFVERVVEAGDYQNASEAIRDALRVLQQKRREDALTLGALRAQVKAALNLIEHEVIPERLPVPRHCSPPGIVYANGLRRGRR